MIIIDYDSRITDEEKTNDYLKENLETISSYVNRIRKWYKISFPDFRKTSLIEQRKLYPPTFKK